MICGFSVTSRISTFAQKVDQLFPSIVHVYLTRYKEYYEHTASGYRFSRQYFYVLAARLGFVIIFQYFVFFVVALLDWLIPDVPYELEVKMQRENFVAKEFLFRSEAETTRDCDAQGIQGIYASSVSLPLKNARLRNKNGIDSKIGIHQV